MLIEKIQDLLKDIDDDAKYLSLNDANKRAEQLKNCYSEADRSKDSEIKQFRESKDYKDGHTRFFYEFEPLRQVATYLSGKSEELQGINFCAQKQSLGYDGTFKLNGAAVRLEVTRAVDGQNEALKQERLDKHGIAPYGQPIDSNGSKHKREFGPNEPQAHRIDTQEFSLKLQEAFNNKNLEKYKDCWLIISLHSCWGEELIFYKSCLDFWDNIGQDSGFFKRIFVVLEEVLVGCSNRNPLWDSENSDCYLHYKDL